MARRAVVLVSSVWLCTTLMGCSSDEKPAPPGGDEQGQAGDSGLSGDVTCTDDARVDTYSAGVEKDGMLGKLAFSLRSADPAPPAKGDNTFVVSITDTGGNPVTGDLVVNPTMPDHGHGTSEAPMVTVDTDTGLYTVTPLDLFMAGVWKIQLNFFAEGGDPLEATDFTTFYFCIEG